MQYSQEHNNEREGKQRGVEGNRCGERNKFQEVMVDNEPFIQYILENIVIEKFCLIVRIVYSPLGRPDQPLFFFLRGGNKHEETTRMVQEAARSAL